ncbi:MAG: hypothetical protein FWB99_01245 [Treponema sp.]|nr:hypothetical protein [Treponema sp.]
MALLFAGKSPRDIFPQTGQPGTGTLTIGTIPEALRRPQRGESPRYPQDVVIGELGRGQAPEEAYRFALSILAAMAAGNSGSPALQSAPPALIASHIQDIGSMDGPRNVRLGGGRVEADGNVSFLVRFVGREESVTGELFIRRAENTEQWFFDDIVLEEKRSLAEIRDSHRFIFSPYERFF